MSLDAVVLAFGRGELKETALYLLLLWLFSTYAASWLSERKGYGEKPGLAAGLFLSVIGAIIMLLWPARKDSKWKVIGPFGSGRADGKSVAEVRAEMAASGEETHSG
jgi:hypothetical protein